MRIVWLYFLVVSTLFMQLRIYCLVFTTLISLTSATMFKFIPNKKLFISEPNPLMFGNPKNVLNEKWTNKNWLKSRFHFSFAEYFNPHNTNFGALRVMNDDLVQPDRGFGTHPHSNMEICTYVVSGNLTHKDSMGTAETLSRGAIQFMTAGTGVRHSEHNLNTTEPLRFIQMWIQPRARNLKPNYGSATEMFENRHNKFAHLVSDVQNTIEKTPVQINQDVNIYASEFDAGKSVEFKLKEGRQAYVLCIEGEKVLGAINNPASSTFSMEQHDGGEAYGPCKLSFENKGINNAHMIIVEMKREDGGRTDL